MILNLHTVSGLTVPDSTLSKIWNKTKWPSQQVVACATEAPGAHPLRPMADTQRSREATAAGLAASARSRPKKWALTMVTRLATSPRCPTSVGSNRSSQFPTIAGPCRSRPVRPDRSKACPTHVHNMSMTHITHVQNMSNTCLKHLQDMTNTCPNHVQ